MLIYIVLVTKTLPLNLECCEVMLNREHETHLIRIKIFYLHKSKIHDYLIKTKNNKLHKSRMHNYLL